MLKTKDSLLLYIGVIIFSFALLVKFIFSIEDTIIDSFQGIGIGMVLGKLISWIEMKIKKREC